MKITTRDLAERIATDLLTPFAGREGDRLQIMRGPIGNETGRGGYCKESLIAAIQKHLDDVARQVAEEKK